VAFTRGQSVGVEDFAHLQDFLRLLGHFGGAALGRCCDVELGVIALLAPGILPCLRRGESAGAGAAPAPAGAREAGEGTSELPPAAHRQLVCRSLQVSCLGEV